MIVHITDGERFNFKVKIDAAISYILCLIVMEIVHLMFILWE